MKKLLLSLCAISAASTMSISADTATLSDITTSSPKTNISLNNGDVIMSFGGSGTATATYDGHYRMYAGNTLTITPGTDVTLERVVITFTTTSYNLTTASGTVSTGTYTESGTTGTWTAPPEEAVSSLVITNKKTNQARISSVVVTYSTSGFGEKVIMSFPQADYTAYIGETFATPVLTITPEEARNEVLYNSEDESVATVSSDGSITIISAGSTKITAAIENSDIYKSVSTSYTLTVKDPNGIETAISPDFFNYKTGSYAAKSNTDELGFTFSTVYSYNNGMQYNTSNTNGKGCGITVTAVNDDYIISSIDIEMTTLTNTNGLNVYSRDTAFPVLQTSSALTIPSDATKLNPSVIQSSTSVDINARAFAIRPNATGVIVVHKVTVYYAKTGASVEKIPSELAFSAAEWSVEEGTEDLSGAPSLSNPLELAVVYTSSNEDVATYVDGELMIGEPGIATITVSPADAETYEGNATYTLTVTHKPVLGKITVNGTEVGESFTCVEGTPIVFAAENAGMIIVEVLDENDAKVFEAAEESASATWTDPATGTYIASVDVTGVDREDSALFTIVVTEKPAISPVADFIFTGENANVATLASKTIEATNSTANGTSNDLNGVILTAENGVTVTIAVSANESHPRYWLNNSNSVTEARIYKGNTLTVAAPADYKISSVEYTIGDSKKWNLTGASAGQFDATAKTLWSNNRETVTSVEFTTPGDRTDIGSISVTIVPVLTPEYPTIHIDGAEITDFDEAIDLNKGTKTVTVTATDETHHIYHKHSAAETAQNEAPLADTEEGYTWIQSHTAEIPVSANGTLSIYSQHPGSGLKSEVKSLIFTGDSTAIVEVETGVNSVAEWFDLTGRRVGRPAKSGVYILKQGSITSKRAF